MISTSRKIDDLETFFRRLCAWERRPPFEFVAKWKPTDVTGIKKAFKGAARLTHDAQPLAVAPSVTIQSLGNRLARYFVTQINPHLAGYQISECPGGGYPDARLQREKDGRAFPFEIKATTHFDERDENRMTVTSKSEKLRRCFAPPICHLFATLIFRRHRGQARVRAVRLDFLGPRTPIHIRLEGSVSQRILARKSRWSTWLRWSSDLKSCTDIYGCARSRSKRRVSARRSHRQMRRSGRGNSGTRRH
jgi:hypothetical protein